MNIITATVVTKKTTIDFTQAEIEDIIIAHLRDKHDVNKDNPEFFWSSNGSVAIDFVEEDVKMSEAIADADGKLSDDGWIPWTGGDCPVPGYSDVNVRFSSDLPSWKAALNMVHKAGRLRWHHTGGPGDIVAYRLSK